MHRPILSLFIHKSRLVSLPEGMGPLGSSVAPKQGLKPNEGPLTFFLDKAESLSVWNKEEGLSPLRQIFEDSHMRELNRRLSSSDRLSIGPSRKPSPFANLLRCRFGYESLVLWRECPSRKWLCAFVPLGPGYKTFFLCSNKQRNIPFKNCWWVDSNSGRLVSEATTVPTVSEPSPMI